MDIKIKGRENEFFSCTNVKQINIYENGKILFQIEDHTFSEYTTDHNGVFSSTYDGKPTAVILEKEPVRAIKENLNRKDNYYKKYSAGPYSWQNGIALYIHGSEIAVTDDGEKLAFQSKEEKNYIRAYTLQFKHGVIMNRHKIERVENVGPDWTLPTGARWSDTYGTKEHPHYKSFDNRVTGEFGILKRWTEPETIYTLQTAIGPYCRTEYSTGRTKAKEIAKYLNENKVFYKDVSFYEIENLMKHFDLKRRENNGN